MCDNARRDYCFTAWREPKPEFDKIKYICWGLERCPTSNKEHYQGFIILNRTARLKGVKLLIGGGDDCHIEARRASRHQAREYCRKDGVFTEFGVFERMTHDELFKQDLNFLKENYPAFFCRYYKGLALLKSSNTIKWRDVEVRILWGEPGCGKTRRVMEMDDVYKLDHPYKWWDGYFGESILLLDDYKRGAIERGLLLNLLDGYKLRLETKGGHVWAAWTKVYITTNFDPERWLDEALSRRVTMIEHIV